MVLDYIIDMPCEPKRRLGEEALLGRLRLLAHARYAEELAPEDAAGARQAMFDLQPLAFHCARCPANASGHEFGCYGCVHEPVSIEAEEWLMDRLPLGLSEKHEAEDAPGQVERVRELIERLRAANVTGKPLDELRRGRLAVRPRPLVRTYGSLFRRRRVSASQLLEIICLGGRLEPGMGEALCRALAVWQDGGTGDDGLPEAVFTEPPSDTDDQPTADLKQFFLTVMTACSLDLPVLTWHEPDLHAAPAAAPTIEPAAAPA